MKTDIIQIRIKDLRASLVLFLKELDNLSEELNENQNRPAGLPVFTGNKIES